jgi:hypothetical protein
LAADHSDCRDILSVKVAPIDGNRVRADSFAKIREFIWSHWIEKKCGKLLIHAVSKEGVVSDSNDRIILEQGKPAFIGAISRSDGSSSSFEAYAVERVSLEPPYFVEDAKLIPNERIVAPSEYGLRLRTKTAKLLLTSDRALAEQQPRELRQIPPPDHPSMHSGRLDLGRLHALGLEPFPQIAVDFDQMVLGPACDP